MNLKTKIWFDKHVVSNNTTRIEGMCGNQTKIILNSHYAHQQNGTTKFRTFSTQHSKNRRGWQIK